MGNIINGNLATVKSDVQFVIAVDASGNAINSFAGSGSTSINGAEGALSLVGGTGIAISTNSQTITINSINNASGNLFGPASSIDQTVAIYNGTTGKIIQDANTLLYSTSLASFSEGSGSTATGAYSHAEGLGTFAYGTGSHTEGNGAYVQIQAFGGHAEGNQTIVSANYGHAEGISTQANGPSSHSEGNSTQANGDSSHAEGNGCYAVGANSHAEGEDTEADGRNGHAEGVSTQAMGQNSHAQGSQTIASGNASFAAGINAYALHNVSIVFNDNQGIGTPIASTKVGEFTIGMSGGIRLISGTSMFPEISGLNTVGTASLPFSGMYASQFYGQPILLSPNGTRYGIVVSNAGILTATAF